MVIHLFGDKLKELRKNYVKKDNTKGLTQEDIAKLCDVKFATVSAWENNKSTPDYDTLKIIAKLFNVTTDYLLGFNQEDYEKMEKLKIALKEAGMMVGNDLTQEELQKALDIVEMLKEKK